MDFKGNETTILKLCCLKSINVKLWNDLRWDATFYQTAESCPFLFLQNKIAAKSKTIESCFHFERELFPLK